MANPENSGGLEIKRSGVQKLLSDLADRIRTSNDAEALERAAQNLQAAINDVVSATEQVEATVPPPKSMRELITGTDRNMWIPMGRAKVTD